MERKEGCCEESVGYRQKNKGTERLSEGEWEDNDNAKGGERGGSDVVWERKSKHFQFRTKAPKQLALSSAGTANNGDPFQIFPSHVCKILLYLPRVTYFLTFSSLY